MKNYFLLLGACVLLGSCSTEDAAMTALINGSSSQALLYLNCRAVSQNEVEFEFSRQVTVKRISFEPELSIASVENGSVVRVRLEEGTLPGIMLTADLLAEDEKRNSINVLVSFRSKNDRMPRLVINELCTEYSNPKAEFIELKMKSAGNLGAMRIYIAGNSNASKQTIYEFSPVEVKASDYVVLHLRTLDPSSRDEYGGVSESGGADASPTARDFWISGSSKLLHKTAAVYVLDQDDRVIDAVMISEAADSWWTKDYFAEAAGFLFEQGAWKSREGGICGPADSVSSAGTTNTRTICRDETAENTHTAADWYITATSNATPGRENSQKRL